MLHWRIAEVAQAAQDSSFPFFIQWGASTPLPGRATVVHRAGIVALGELTIEAHEQRLHEWLGTRSLPIRVTPGSQGPVPGHRAIIAGHRTKRLRPPRMAVRRLDRRW